MFQQRTPGQSSRMIILREMRDAAEGFADDNPLINSNHYEVYMSDVSKQQDIVEHAQSLEGVGNVNKSDVVAKTLTKLNSLIWYVSIAIIAILLAVSVFLISNTVTMVLPSGGRKSLL